MMHARLVPPVPLTPRGYYSQAHPQPTEGRYHHEHGGQQPRVFAGAERGRSSANDAASFYTGLSSVSPRLVAAAPRDLTAEWRGGVTSTTAARAIGAARGDAGHSTAATPSRQLHFAAAAADRLTNADDVAAAPSSTATLRRAPGASAARCDVPLTEPALLSGGMQCRIVASRDIAQGAGGEVAEHTTSYSFPDALMILSPHGLELYDASSMSAAVVRSSLSTQSLSRAAVTPSALAQAPLLLSLPWADVTRVWHGKTRRGVAIVGRVAADGCKYSQSAAVASELLPLVEQAGPRGFSGQLGDATAASRRACTARIEGVQLSFASTTDRQAALHRVVHLWRDRRFDRMDAAVKTISAAQPQQADIAPIHVVNADASTAPAAPAADRSAATARKEISALSTVLTRVRNLQAATNDLLAGVQQMRTAPDTADSAPPLGGSTAAYYAIDDDEADDHAAWAAARQERSDGVAAATGDLHAIQLRRAQRSSAALRGVVPGHARRENDTALAYTTAAAAAAMPDSPAYRDGALDGYGDNASGIPLQYTAGDDGAAGPPLKECPHCNRRMPKDIRASHPPRCAQRPVSCPDCGMAMTAKVLKEAHRRGGACQPPPPSRRRSAAQQQLAPLVLSPHGSDASSSDSFLSLSPGLVDRMNGGGPRGPSAPGGVEMDPDDEGDTEAARTQRRRDRKEREQAARRQRDDDESGSADSAARDARVDLKRRERRRVGDLLQRQQAERDSTGSSGYTSPRSASGSQRGSFAAAPLERRPSSSSVVRCPHCLKNAPRAHQDKCGHRAVTCKWCRQDVVARDAARHSQVCEGRRALKQQQQDGDAERSLRASASFQQQPQPAARPASFSRQTSSQRFQLRREEL
jgi:hypothetical protein